MATIRIRLIPASGTAVDTALGMSPLVVGTDPSCDLRTLDPKVSRRHCELRLTKQGISLIDLGSKNGTFINGIPVSSAILHVGATAVMGGTRLSASIDGAPSRVLLSVESYFGAAIGGSIPMRALFATLERVAPSLESVLLLGESGTGKEVLARAIHAASPRCDGPFVTVDCSAIAPSLVEAELFGHARGAFTGAIAAREGLLEQANDGTLFLDEIGELPADMQPKLLRALEARQVRRIGSGEWRPFNARVIAATHRDLRARVADRSFREDLYYRLAVMEVRVPSLRERKDDIPRLVEHFLSTPSPLGGPKALPLHAMELLMAHDWPGNVRELRNTVARLALFPEFTGEALAGLIGGEQRAASRVAPGEAAAAGPGHTGGEDTFSGLMKLPLHEAREFLMEQFERRYLITKLAEHGGNVSRTAAAIGASRQHLYRLIERYGLRIEDTRGEER